MTPDEVWLFMEANIPEQTYGRLRQSEVDELEERYNELSEKGIKLA